MLAAAALVIIGTAGAVFLFAHGPVTATSLKSAVERESGSQAGVVVDDGGCQRRGRGSWHCEVVDSGTSGMATYKVRLTSGSCWTGQLDGSVGEPMPERISGCVLRFVD